MKNNIIPTCNCKLAEVLRSAIPKQGIDFKNMIQVHMKPGDSISKHQHTDHTALYYPADSEPVTVIPTAGMIIYLPPGTPHAVPKVINERVSLAMLVEPEKGEA